MLSYPNESKPYVAMIMKIFSALSNSELAIMEVLWEADRITAPEIRVQVYPDAAKSQHGTVQKLLQRLEEKGFVLRDKTHSLHFFSPRISRDDYAANQIESLVDRLGSGSIAPLITNLIERKRISSEDIKSIREILDKDNGGRA